MITLFDAALVGLVFGFTAPIGVVFWSYLFYKLVLKSVKYNVSRGLESLKAEVLG